MSIKCYKPISRDYDTDPPVSPPRGRRREGKLGGEGEREGKKQSLIDWKIKSYSEIAVGGLAKTEEELEMSGVVCVCVLIVLLTLVFIQEFHLCLSVRDSK